MRQINRLRRFLYGYFTSDEQVREDAFLEWTRRTPYHERYFASYPWRDE